MNYQQAARYLNLSKHTLYTFVARGVVPHLRYAPRTVRFDRKQLDEWIKQRQVPAEN